MQTAVALTENDLVLGRYRPLRPLGSGGGGSVWLARDETGRSGRRAEGRRTRGEARRARRARGRRRHRAPPSALPARARTRTRRAPRLRRLSVRRRPHAARRSPRRRRRRLERRRDRARRCSRRSRTPTRKGIVHRDVKPANVMLEEGDEVSVQLLDFGLAQLEHADTLTAVGDVPGTLAYIAPERLAGAEATGAADVWAVGVLLWEALAGRHPFWVRLAARDGAPGRGGRTAARRAAPRPPAGALPRRRPDALARPSQAPDREAGAQPPAEPSSEGRSGAPPRETLARRPPRARATRCARGPLRRREPRSCCRSSPPAGRSCSAPLPALVALLSPIAGLAVALAVPILPLGNISLGLAIAYVPLALAWLLLFARDARSSLLFLAGPVLAFVHLLPLAPVVALRSARPGPPGRAGQSPRSRPPSRLSLVLGLRLPLTGGASPAPEASAATSDPQRRCRRRSRRSDEPSDRRGRRSSSSRSPPPRPASPGAAASGASPAWGTAFLGALLLVPLAAGGTPVGRPLGRPGRLARDGRSGVSARSGASLECSDGHTVCPDHERPAKHRAPDRVDRRGRVRTRLPNARAAGRARPQAGEGDGRGQERLRLAGLRPERVHALPLPERPRPVLELRGLTP